MEETPEKGKENTPRPSKGKGGAVSNGMRVLITSTDRSVFKGGSATRGRFETYAQALGELHVVVFSLRATGNSPERVGNHLFLYPTDSHSKFGYIPDAIKLGRTLPQPDIVSCQDPFETGIAAARIAAAHEAPLLAQVHTDLASSEFRRHSFLNRVRLFVAPWVLRQANCVRVVSERIKHSLSTKHWNLKTEPVVLPIPIERPVQRTTKEKKAGKTVLVVSRLEPEKDVGVALQAFARATAGAEDTHLTIVGDGSERAPLEALAHKLGIEKRVKFVGAQNNLADYYSAADVFLATSRYEGYGLALMEAAAAGLPIVTTDVGVVGFELPHEAVLSCAPGDVACLAEKLNTALLDHEAAAHLSAAASKAETQSWQEYLQGFVRLFTGCAQ